MAVKITKRFLETAPLKSKQYEIWDNEVIGLHVIILPSSRKTFYFRYYDAEKKNQRVKIGAFSNVTCEMAREIAKGLAGDVAKGIDPKKNQLQQKDAKSPEKILFSELFEIFTQRHRLVHHKPSTLKRDAYRVRKYILPFFGHKECDSILPRDIAEFKKALEDTPGTYNKCFNLLRPAFEMAEIWNYRPQNSNPCKRIKKYPERKMDRFLKEEELRRLEKALEDEEKNYRASPYIINAIRLLMYTGARMGEALTLKWEDVHLEESYVSLGDSKVGARDVPLNTPSIKALKTLDKLPDNPYVFCNNRKNNSHVVNIEKAWYKIRRNAGLEDVRIHDLRHSFASFAIKKGLDLYQVAKLLGHKSIQTTMRYAHLAREDLINSSNIVGQIFNN